MFEYIFDYQQRLVNKDELKLSELLLLFYFEKKIINEEFLKAKYPRLIKNFNINTILTDLPILCIKRMQLTRLMDTLTNAGYIKAKGFYSGVTISITKKTIFSLSKKQFEDPARQKYLCLIDWTNNIYPKLLKNEQLDKLTKEQIAQIWAVWDTYYNNYITNTGYSNINKINNIDTKKCNIISSNKKVKKKCETFFTILKPFFDKYPRFKVDKATLLPSDFDCQRLMQAMERSQFLQKNERIDFEWLMAHYAKVTTKFESGKFTYDDFNYEQEHKAFITRDYDPEELNKLFIDDLDSINL